MKRAFTLINSLAIALLAIFTLTGDWVAVDNGTPAQSETYVDFNKIFQSKLFTETERLKEELHQAFEDEAPKLTTFTFDFENQSVEQILDSFQNYVDDIADNYLITMYAKINDPETGIEKLVTDACVDFFADPLTGMDCTIQTKEEYALEKAEGVLEAIAEEYQQLLRKSGTDFTIKSGLLDKGIELKQQALTFEDLPSLTVQDPAWLKNFAVKKKSIWDDVIWPAVKQSAENSSNKLVNDFKKEVSDFAGQTLKNFEKSAGEITGPLRQEIDTYATNLNNIKDGVIKKLDDAKNAVEEKLKGTKDIITQSTKTFIDYVQSSLNSLATIQVITPLQDARQQALDKATAIKNAPLLEPVPDETKNSIESSTTNLATKLTPSVNSLATNIDALDVLQTSIASWLQSLDIQAEPVLTENLSESDKATVVVNLKDINSSLSSFKQFINPLKKTVADLKSNLDTVTNTNPFGDLAKKTQDEAQKALDDIINTIVEASAVLQQPFDDLKTNLAQIMTTGAQQIITDSTKELDALDATIFAEFSKYIESKKTIIDDMIKQMSDTIKDLQDNFVDRVAGFISDPSKAFEDIKNQVTCKEMVGDTCKTTWVAELTKQLDSKTITSDLDALYKKISNDLAAFFTNFKEASQALLQKQQKGVEETFNQGLKTAQIEGQNLKTVLTDTASQLVALADTLKVDATASSDAMLQALSTIKKNSTSINDSLKQADNILGSLKTVGSKIDSLLNLKGASKQLTTALQKLKKEEDSLANAFKQIITQGTSLVADATGETIDALSSLVSSAAVDRIKEQANKLNGLKSKITDLSELIDNTTQNLEQRVFKVAKNLIANLNPDELGLITKAQAVVSNAPMLKDSIAKISDSVGVQVIDIQVVEQSLVVNFATAESAQKVQTQLQTTLPPTLTKWLTIIPKNNSLTIEPNILSVTAEKFKGLFDDIKEVLAEDILDALKAF